jgi:hypothetical protein
MAARTEAEGWAWRLGLFTLSGMCGIVGIVGAGRPDLTLAGAVTQAA